MHSSQSFRVQNHLQGQMLDEIRNVAVGPTWNNPADADWVIMPSSGNMFAFPTCRSDHDHFWLFRSEDFVFFFPTNYFTLILMNTFWALIGKNVTTTNVTFLIFFKYHFAAKSKLCTFSSLLSQFPSTCSFIIRKLNFSMPRWQSTISH